MRRIKRACLLCVVGGVLSTTPAIAVTTQSDNTGTNVGNNTAPQFGPTQSDNTGTNVGNNTAPQFGPGSKIEQVEIFNNARRLSQEIEQANAACAASSAAAAKLPRRFARGPGDATVQCNSPECQRLNSLLEEAKTFLNGLDSNQAARLRASRARIW